MTSPDGRAGGSKRITRSPALTHASASCRSAAGFSPALAAAVRLWSAPPSPPTPATTSSGRLTLRSGTLQCRSSTSTTARLSGVPRPSATTRALRVTLMLGRPPRDSTLPKVLDHDLRQYLADTRVLSDGDLSELVEDHQIEEHLDPARQARQRSLSILRHVAPRALGRPSDSHQAQRGTCDRDQRFRADTEPDRRQCQHEDERQRPHGPGELSGTRGRR